MDSTLPYTVSVRSLCDFSARQGDLDLRFTPSPTAQQGIAGHQWVTGSRAAGYETEIPLQGQVNALRVRGRADGYDPQLARLEEIKTHRGDLARQPANHRYRHWAQLKVYGALLCQARALSSIRLALVYFDLNTQQETVFEEEHTAPVLQAYFEGLCAPFEAWARQEMAHRAARDQALTALTFAHPHFRPGQRELAASVWRAAGRGGALMVQAPTGIGKTVGTLFPLLKAAPGQRLDKIVFLAARTPGRQIALDALERLRASGAHALRVLELTAREKACEHPDKACHGDSCPLARGFYDRLAAARAAALTCTDAASVRLTALAHQVCPYWLTHELVRWADVVVGDYHYWFDTSALVHALAIEHDWRCAVLVDEAHNLPERARQMYSAQLDEVALHQLRRQAPAPLKKPLEKLARSWRDLVRDSSEDYIAHAHLPARWVLSLQQAITAMADHLAQSPEVLEGPASALQEFYFGALAMGRLAETFGNHSLFDVSLRAEPGRRKSSVLCIRNLVPAPHLAPRFASAQVAVLFSATLGPAGFYQDILGLPEETTWTEVDSPFSADQLSVRLVPGISTRWADRARSVAPIAALIAEQFEQRPGNYLAFFSSHDYLRSVATHVAQNHPQLPIWEQSPRMSEAERRSFIDRFAVGGQGVGFAVLGGSFGEGIDLPGDRLVGAFIATLGLPQINPINEQMKERMEQAFGAGFDYAYLYPGIRKVVQAAGRVIRTPEDRGVVYLIDDRFCRPQVRRLLPAWWQPQVAGVSDLPP